MVPKDLLLVTCVFTRETLVFVGSVCLYFIHHLTNSDFFFSVSLFPFYLIRISLCSSGCLKLGALSAGITGVNDNRHSNHC